MGTRSSSIFSLISMVFALFPFLTLYSAKVALSGKACHPFWSQIKTRLFWQCFSLTLPLVIVNLAVMLQVFRGNFGIGFELFILGFFYLFLVCFMILHAVHENEMAWGRSLKISCCLMKKRPMTIIFAGIFPFLLIVFCSYLMQAVPQNVMAVFAPDSTYIQDLWKVVDAIEAGDTLLPVILSRLPMACVILVISSSITAWCTVVIMGSLACLYKEYVEDEHTLTACP